ncbi:MAG: hypothetical protein Q7S31_01095 [bacterium]|nr:hypothetical protein [bacterium]
MSFLKTNRKKTLWIIILVALALVLANYFINANKPPDNREIGTLDTGPHPAEVQLRFEREYNGLKFQDALNLTQKEYDSLTKEEILKMQDERFNNWVKIITAPPVEETNTSQ